MDVRSERQRERLVRLADHIARRREPLGVGLKNQCWAGVAIGMAKAEGCTVTDYLGLTSRQVKAAIKLNNRTPADSRNERMLAETLNLLGS
jgi:hypothetical protein